jgi:hypothetical protein
MKRIIILTCFAILLLNPGKTFSQDINWNNIEGGQRHLINVNAGLDYGLTYGARYGYRLKSRIPILLTLEGSIPSGENLTDDFKTKIGASFRLYQSGHFQVAGKIQGVFRRYENSYARLLNFGSDMGLTAGYYKHKWFAAGEAGFDKAIVTHFKHSAAYKQNFPPVKDGWYEPATGGNFYYGLQTGYSCRRNDIYLKGGKILTQDFKSTPLLPFYLQLGVNIWLK